MIKSLDLLISEINKKFGGENVINRASKFKTLHFDRIPTGSSFLDWATGGGLPRGKIIEMYGLPSGGKSLLSAFTVAQTQRLGGECVWIDCETALDPDFMTKLGVDMKKLIVSQSSIGEFTLDLVCKILEAEPDLIVIDSVASMIPKVDLEEPLEHVTMATRARLMSKGLAKINTLNKKSLIIFINQLRTNIAAYGAPDTTPGGRALPHYAALRIEIRRGEFIMDGKEKIGQIINFKVTKNKTGQPWRQGYFKYYYEGYIDKEDELVSLALLNKKIQPTGTWFEILGVKLQGREAIADKLKSDPEFLKKFKAML